MAQLLLKRAWPSKGQPKEWEAMRADVHAGWLDAVEEIDRERILFPAVNGHPLLSGCE